MDPKLIDPKIIDDLAKRLMGSLPEGVQSMQQDLETNFKGALNSVLGKMNLVSREEFDVQAAVLQKTRAKLEHLLERLAELEEADKK